MGEKELGRGKKFGAGSREKSRVLGGMVRVDTENGESETGDRKMG
jgi:hypothetical protein